MPDCGNRTVIQDMAKFFKGIGKSGKGKRKRSLTKDTSEALYNTLKGIVELCCCVAV